MTKNKFLAIIPARGGSKRLPNKNILMLNEKPLIAYSIEAALKSKYIDKTIVTSDNNKILKISKKHGASILKRPNYLAKDKSTTFDTIKHTLANIKKFKYIVLLQPTSPLRTTEDIDKAIKLLKKKNADSIISMCEVDHPVQWCIKIDTDKSIDNLSKKINSHRSQDLDKYYRLNGAIYIIKVKELLKQKSLFLNKKVYPYIMDKQSSIDIDDELDFLITKSIINKRKI